MEPISIQRIRRSWRFPGGNNHLPMTNSCVCDFERSHGVEVTCVELYVHISYRCILLLDYIVIIGNKAPQFISQSHPRSELGNSSLEFLNPSFSRLSLEKLFLLPELAGSPFGASYPVTINFLAVKLVQVQLVWHDPRQISRWKTSNKTNILSRFFHKLMRNRSLPSSSRDW